MAVVLTERRIHRRALPHLPGHPPGGTVRALGLGVITGAADDDPSAIGTYASAGAKFGLSVLWTAPALLPMMAVIVYLAAKVGQVTGQGLAAVIRTHFPRWVLLLVVIAVVVGNVIEAGADLGGVAAALGLLAPLPELAWIVPLAAAILAIQVFGSYTWIRTVFRWLAMALLAYVGAALLAHPSYAAVARATLLPRLHWNRDYLALLVAVIGTSLSPYLYVWQASQEVEEDLSMGRRRLSDRKGTTAAQLKSTAWDVIVGMVFSNVIMYFILLATAVALFSTGVGTTIHSAAEAARALQPLAGRAAGILFALGVVGVGFLAIPVMTVGAAYAVCDAMGWKSGLSARPRDARQFYAVIATATIVAAAINFFGFNPMQALVAAGVVQGFLAPGLMLLLLLMTSRRAIMGSWTNTRVVNILGWATALLCAAATAVLVVSLVA